MVRATHRGNGLFVKGVVTLGRPVALGLIGTVQISVFFMCRLPLQLFPDPGPGALLLPQVTQNEDLFASRQGEL